MPSGGAPYPISAFAARLPWNYFAGSFGRSSTSVVNSANLVTKVYFSRLIILLSSTLSGLVDFTVAFLVALMAYYGIAPTAAVVYLPGFILPAMITALGFELWLASLNVRDRDINCLAPFRTQIWMYVIPVIYGSTLIPELYRRLPALNPMTGVVESRHPRHFPRRAHLHPASGASVFPLHGLVLYSVISLPCRGICWRYATGSAYPNRSNTT